MFYIVVNIGCIECGVSSNVVLLTEDKEKANKVCNQCGEKYEWREGGQNSFQVFEVLMDTIPMEYEI